jgi:riboflavin kinase / FMN adenylyltransferase
MQTLHSADDFRSDGRKVSVAIGMFDGVHLGHQQLIRQAVSDAEQHEGLAVVVTFDRHPNNIIAPERVPPLIYSPSQKERAISGLGVEATVIIPFTQEFSQQPAEAFVRMLTQRLSPMHSVSVGSSFVFGHRRGGNVTLLQKLGQEFAFVVHGIAAVSLDNEVVSSTRIREAVRAGDFNAASQMLGREYALCGRVMQGDQLGRKLGFPTANLNVRGLLVPAGGVYAVHAYVDGKRYRAAANIGTRPTLRNNTPETRVEVHLLDFEGDIYGREMEITFVAKLRNEQKFASLDELRAQIARDVAKARSSF